MSVFFALETINLLGFKSQVLTRLRWVVLLWFSHPSAVLFKSLSCMSHTQPVWDLGGGGEWPVLSFSSHIGACCSYADPCTCRSGKHRSSHTTVGSYFLKLFPLCSLPQYFPLTPLFQSSGYKAGALIYPGVLHTFLGCTHIGVKGGRSEKWGEEEVTGPSPLILKPECLYLEGKVFFPQSHWLLLDLLVSIATTALGSLD